MRPGFTLLELLVAVLLVALVGGIALVSLDGLTARTRVEAAARCIEQAFRLARSEAIVSGLPRRLLLDAQGHAVQIDRPRVGPEGLTWSAGPRLALDGHVALEFANDGPTVRTAAAQGVKTLLLCIWPDGIGQSCQLRLAEAGQTMDVVIDGRSVAYSWMQPNGQDAKNSAKP